MADSSVHKNKRKSQKYPGYLKMRLFLSPAFRELRPAAKDILTYLFMHVELKHSNKGKTKHVVTNRNEIVIPYQDIKEYLEYGDKAIWSAFKQFLAHGFLKVIRYGGGRKGDFQIYGIVEDWRTWESGQVIRELRKNGKLGFQKKNKQSTGKST